MHRQDVGKDLQDRYEEPPEVRFRENLLPGLVSHILFPVNSLKVCFFPRKKSGILLGITVFSIVFSKTKGEINDR